MILNSVDSFGIGLLLFVLIPLSIFLAIFIPTSIVRRKYKKFVLEHSTALKQLDNINNCYQFKTIPNFNMEHSYDNENFYGDISCQDYLTYQLVYIQKKVSAALKDTLDNKTLFDKYKREIKESCVMNQFDTDVLLRNRNRLIKFEKYYFGKQLKIPTISFSIVVTLRLTNINGAYRGYKRDEFSPKEIKEIISKNVSILKYLHHFIFNISKKCNNLF